MSHDLLPSNLWQVIGFKLDSVADRIRFRAVSKSWNSLLPARQLPLLMLAEKEEEDEDKDEDEDEDEEEEEEDEEEEDKEKEEDEEEEEAVCPPRRGFVILGQQQIYEIDFPEVHQARVVGSTGNWLITMHLDKTLRLLNPFSRLQIYLPAPSTFEDAAYRESGGISPEVYRDSFVYKIVLSSSPDAHDCIAVAIYHFRQVLAIARLGEDESWTTLQTPYSPNFRNLYIQDVIFYKQQFYAVDKDGKLIVCDDGDCSNPPKLWYLNDGIETGYEFPVIYLVEWLGELLLVIKIVDNFEDPDNYKTNGFQLYKLGSENNKWNELKSLGEYSLFLGFNTSVSLLASDYFGIVKRNCIYFTDDYAYGYRGNSIPGGHDMGVYDLEDKSITPHYRGMSTSLYSPPVWIIPS